MRAWMVVLGVALGLQSASALPVARYPQGEKWVFDVLFVAQQVESPIFLSYQGKNAVYRFSVQGVLREFTVGSAQARIGKELITLSQPAIKWDSYPVLPVEDFPRVFPELQAEWFDALSPSAVRSSSVPVKPPTATSGAVSRRELVVDEGVWWQALMKGGRMTEVPCPAGASPGEVTLGCAEATSSVQDMRNYIVRSVPQGGLQESAVLASGYAARFVLQNGLTYALRVQVSGSRLRVVFSR